MVEVEVVERYGRFLQMLSGELGLLQLLSNEDIIVVFDVKQLGELSQLLSNEDDWVVTVFQ